MTKTPLEQGAHDAGRAIEATRRIGLTKDEVLNFYLGGEGQGIQGALNAATNTYGEDAPAEIKTLYVLGWTSALLHLKLHLEK